MTSKQERFLKALFASTAVKKFAGNRKHDLNFGDACRFWGLEISMKGDAFDKQVKKVEDMLAELDSKLLADPDGEGIGDRTGLATDVWVVICVHRFLKERFERHLRILRDKGGWR